jgi:hypothetical protein
VAPFFRCLDRLAVDHGGAGALLATLLVTHFAAQAVVHLLPGIVLAPTPRVVVDGPLRREVMREEVPLTAGAEHVVDGVEHLAHIGRPLSTAGLGRWDQRFPLPANRLGFRRIALEIKDLNTIVAGLRDKGFDTVSEVQDHEGIYQLCYVCGPEGLIVEFAEQIGSEGAS